MLTKNSSGSAKNKFIIITTISVLIISLFGLVAYRLIDISQKNKAQSISNNFIKMINSNDLSNAYDLLTDSYKNKMDIYTWYAWSTSFQNNKVTISEEPTSTTREGFDIINSKIAIKYDLSNESIFEVKLISERGIYSISDFAVFEN